MTHESPSPNRRRWASALLALAAVFVAAAAFLPLWGMNLVSVQYPEGLRMTVYLDRIVGDITELNMLHHYVGMAEIDRAFFGELDVIRGLFFGVAGLLLVAALVRRWWATLAPLAVLGGTAVYSFARMRRRLWEYGHDLDPTAAMQMEPFTPPMFGEHQIAQFGVYSYFTWGTLLPAIAGALAVAALWLLLRDRRARNATAARSTKTRRTMWTKLVTGSAVVALLALQAACSPQDGETQASAEAADAPEAAEAQGPSEGDLLFQEITADWSDATYEACAGQLEDVLGTRDLVEGVLAGVEDPEGKAEAEVEDAEHWIAEGNDQFEAVRPRLEEGVCDEEVLADLQQAWQFYVKAGTAAVQAGSIAGG